MPAFDATALVLPISGFGLPPSSRVTELGDSKHKPKICWLKSMDNHVVCTYGGFKSGISGIVDFRHC